MSGFTKNHRQKIIDNYLSESGRNMFVPAEFIDWLSDKPENDAYELFYSKTDAEAAREYRIAAARQMASGLRIIAHVEETKAKVVSIRVAEYPSLISPMVTRKHGGGYQPFNREDGEMADELRNQGKTALLSWLDRYKSVFEDVGVDVSEIEKIAGDKPASVAISA